LCLPECPGSFACYFSPGASPSDHSVATRVRGANSFRFPCGSTDGNCRPCPEDVGRGHHGSCACEKIPASYPRDASRLQINSLVCGTLRTPIMNSITRCMPRIVILCINRQHVHHRTRALTAESSYVLPPQPRSTAMPPPQPRSKTLAYLFVVRPNPVVRAEAQVMIERSRKLLKETEEVAKGYKPTMR